MKKTCFFKYTGTINDKSLSRSYSYLAEAEKVGRVGGRFYAWTPLTEYWINCFTGMKTKLRNLPSFVLHVWLFPLNPKPSLTNCMYQSVFQSHELEVADRTTLFPAHQALAAVAFTSPFPSWFALGWDGCFCCQSPTAHKYLLPRHTVNPHLLVLACVHSHRQSANKFVKKAGVSIQTTPG